MMKCVGVARMGRKAPDSRGFCITASSFITAVWRFGVCLPIGFLLALPHALGSEQPTTGFKGEYILMRDNEPESPDLCKTFTRNLNEFRRLPFKQCNPRLSPKYPEFSRPQWEEMQFDLAIAERALKSELNDRYPEAVEKVEKKWQHWLSASEQIRKSGQARMWRTRIDFDGDGLEDSIIRMLPDRQPKIETEPLYNCDYNRGHLFMSETAHPEIASSFRGRYGDIIYFAGDKRYYGVDWDGEQAPTTGQGPQSETPDIGGTAGVLISQLNWTGNLVTRGLSCVIHWVPTGHYRPLKRKTAR